MVMKRMVVMMAVTLLCALPAMGELKFCEGKWRLELSGGPGINTTGSDRSGDFILKSTVEYELPLSSHGTLGLRALPLFLYEQQERGEDTVWGAGLGVGGRIYSVADEYRGWFAEANAHMLGHKHQISGNGSNINFLTGIGVGYKCKAGWHSVLRWEHLSNANLDSDNKGANVITMGVGFTF